MKFVRLSSALLTLALALSICSFAKDKTTTLNIYQPTQVGSATLPPGTYNVKANLTGSTSEVLFLKNGKQVASASGQVMQLSKKAVNTSITVDNSGKVPRISEIQFEGQQSAVGFGAATSASAGE